MGGSPHPISNRVAAAVHTAYMYQKKQEPAPADCLQSNMFEVFDKEKGAWATIAAITDMALGGDDVRIQRSEVARWLGAIGLQSKYVFKREAKPQATAELLDKPFSTRERDTLLTIIAVLCKEAKVDYTKHSKAAGFIQSTAATMGVAIGETTIENHLKKIPDALATRMK